MGTSKIPIVDCDDTNNRVFLVFRKTTEANERNQNREKLCQNEPTHGFLASRRNDCSFYLRDINYRLVASEFTPQIPLDEVFTPTGGSLWPSLGDRETAGRLIEAGRHFAVKCVLQPRSCRSGSLRSRDHQCQAVGCSGICWLGHHPVLQPPGRYHPGWLLRHPTGCRGTHDCTWAARPG